MSTWDERATAEIVRRGRGETWCNSDRRHFRAGAAWQREQLFTDETIERVGRALNTAGCTCLAWAHEPGKYDDCHYCRGTCLNMALTVLTAAIGDQA